MKTFLIFNAGEKRSGHIHSANEAPAAPPGGAVIEITKEQAARNPYEFVLNAGKLEEYQAPPAPTVELPPAVKKELNYNRELGGLGNEIDAVYKGLSLLIPDLIAANVLSPETVQALTPDKTAPPDTPAGWLGKVADIKARNPKGG